MFCFQCQETLNNTGCTKAGVCGKSGKVADMQDLLIWTSKGTSEILTKMKDEDWKREYHAAVRDNLFITITNANFDYDFIVNRVNETVDLNKNLREKLQGPVELSENAKYDGSNMEEKALEVGVLNTEDEDIRSLRELITYGIKGTAAYERHANVLGYYDDSVSKFMEEALAKLIDDSLSVDDLVGLTLDTGSNGVKVMALLDKANTSSYGDPELTQVNIGVRNNPGILISGHDLKDLEMLLDQTRGTGVDVYTHSEMLPANSYPKFKKYENLVGNYGNAWWRQNQEFESFNGPILMTTNCITPPKGSYKDRIFTTGVAGYEGVKHIEEDENGHKDFSQIIEMAKNSQPPEELETGFIYGGLAHKQVIDLAGKIVESVKAGHIKKFIVMAGCDGRSKSREYYTDFAEALPDDTIILTAGCAKYRYNKLNLGDIDGIPRVVDAGQCNDSYSLVLIAQALQEAFGADSINDLPLAFNIAWYEQKAVIVLLALLSLGVKDIHLGPTIPAFLSDNVLDVLVDKFGISGIDSVENDLDAFEIAR